MEINFVFMMTPSGLSISDLGVIICIIVVVVVVVAVMGGGGPVKAVVDQGRQPPAAGPAPERHALCVGGG